MPEHVFEGGKDLYQASPKCSPLYERLLSELLSQAEGSAFKAYDDAIIVVDIEFRVRMLVCQHMRPGL